MTRIFTPTQYDSRKQGYAEVAGRSSRAHYSRHRPPGGFDSTRRPRPTQRHHHDYNLSVVIPPALFELTRAHFAIIKTTHHRLQLADGPPPSLRKKSTFLAQSVNPAFVNDFFRAQMEDIGRVWCEEVLQALQQHYDSVMQDSIDLISSKPMPDELLNTSIRMVTKWAYQQLGRKLKDFELDEALSIIREHQLLHKEKTPMQATPSRETSSSLSQTPSYKNVGSQTDASPELPEIGSSPQQETLTMTTQEPPASEGSLSTGLRNEAAPDPPTAISSATPSPTGQALRHLDERTHSMVQTNLFGNTVREQAPRATRVYLAVERLNLGKNYILFGDENIEDFKTNNACILSVKGGKLNFFKQVLLRCPDDEFRSVKAFILCLSLLDKANLPETNFAALRAIFHRASRILPCARFCIVLFGIPDSSTASCQGNTHNLNELISSRLSTECTICPPAENFSADENSWSPSTKQDVFDKLNSFLEM